MAVSLPNFPTFEVHLDGNTGPRWKKWVTRLERLLTAMNITDKQQKKALMLHFVGPEVDEIFDTLEDTEAETDYKDAVGKLTEYFAPQTNIAYEVYNFRQARQNQGESLDSYHVRLRQLAKTCDFTDIDKEIKEHIILSCTSTTLRRRALQDEYSLDKLLKVGRSLEISEKSSKTSRRKRSSKISRRKRSNSKFGSWQK